MIYEYNDIHSREKRMTFAKQAVMSEKIMVDILKSEEEWEKVMKIFVEVNRRCGIT